MNVEYGKDAKNGWDISAQLREGGRNGKRQRMTKLNQRSWRLRERTYDEEHIKEQGAELHGEVGTKGGRMEGT